MVSRFLELQRLQRRYPKKRELTCIWVFVLYNSFTNLFPLFFMFFQLFLSVFFSSLISWVHIFPTFRGRCFSIAPHFDESIQKVLSRYHAVSLKHLHASLRNIRFHKTLWFHELLELTTLFLVDTETPSRTPMPFIRLYHPSYDTLMRLDAKKLKICSRVNLRFYFGYHNKKKLVINRGNRMFK